MVPSVVVVTERRGGVAVAQERDPPVRGRRVKWVWPAARKTSSGWSPVVSRAAATSFVAMRAGQSRPTLQETTRGASASTSNIHSSAAVVTAAATEHTIIASFMRVSISMYALLIEQTGSIS